MTGIAGVIILVVLVALGGTAPALGVQMHAIIDPNLNTSTFEYVYQRSFIINPLEEESPISTFLDGTEWILEGTVDSSDPGVQKLIADLNRNILTDGSAAIVDDVTVDYKIRLTGRDTFTVIDYKVLLNGTLTNYVITQDQHISLVDMGWRAISSSESVVIDDVDVNIPLNMLQTTEPEIYDLVVNTEAGEILSIPIINADFIRDQPLRNWHQLTDAVGINQHAMKYGLSDALAGKVFDIWTMGLISSMRDGSGQVETIWEATISSNTHPTLHGDYGIRAIQSADIGLLVFVGYATPDELDGIEIMVVTPNAPSISGTPTGNFPVIIIYGMAGMAAVGGGIFFMLSNRSLKNKKEGQQGIDPSRPVGYQTSAASGVYQTNRGEAQLRDQGEYQQTRSYHDQLDTFKPTKGSEITPPATSTPAEAACSCDIFAESNMECDCQMQASCLCDATCSCLSDVCTNHVSML